MAEVNFKLIKCNNIKAIYEYGYIEHLNGIFEVICDIDKETFQEKISFNIIKPCVGEWNNSGLAVKSFINILRHYNENSNFIEIGEYYIE